MLGEEPSGIRFKPPCSERRSTPVGLGRMPSPKRSAADAWIEDVELGRFGIETHLHLAQFLGHLLGQVIGLEKSLSML